MIFIQLILLFALSAYCVDDITFYLALRQNNMDILENIINDISDPLSKNYGNWLSYEEVHTLTAVSDKDVALVTNWLDEFDTTYSNLGDSIMVLAKFDVVENMFNVQMKDGKSLTEPIIPSNLQHIIEVVEGFWLPFKVHFPKQKARSPAIGLVGREVFANRYNFSLDNTVNNVSVCAMEFLGASGFSASGLNVSEVTNGMSSNPISKNHVIDTNNYPDLESTLDIQMITDLANGVDLWYWDSPYWILGWSLNFTSRTLVPEIVSLSWGWSETNQCYIIKQNCSSSEAYVNRTNGELMKMAARGITIVVASGDAGSPGRTDEGCSRQRMNPVFPGSSPWVLSVGATYLTNGQNVTYNKTPLCRQKKCNNGSVEQGTTFFETGWTSGAGFSKWQLRPWWQNNAVINYFVSGVHLPNASTWNPSGRGYPDVSAVGHLCAVYANTRWGGGDGTSCAAPVWAGVLAQINNHQLDKGRSRVGFVNPLLYHLHSVNRMNFNEVSVGNSSCTEDTCCGVDMGFTATVGWDPIGGLGTPNVGVILSTLDALNL